MTGEGWCEAWTSHGGMGEMEAQSGGGKGSKLFRSTSSRKVFDCNHNGVFSSHLVDRKVSNCQGAESLQLQLPPHDTRIHSAPLDLASAPLGMMCVKTCPGQPPPSSPPKADATSLVSTFTPLAKPHPSALPCRVHRYSELGYYSCSGYVLAAHIDRSHRLPHRQPPQ